MIKGLSKKIREDSLNGSKMSNARLFRQDISAKKYIERMTEDSKFTKRTIKELSPWNNKMIRALLDSPFKNIADGLSQILKNNPPPDRVKQAFACSVIFERLAEMKYHDTKTKKN